MDFMVGNAVGITGRHFLVAAIDWKLCSCHTPSSPILPGGRHFLVAAIDWKRADRRPSDEQRERESPLLGGGY